MFLFQDEIYKTENGKYVTKEYMNHHGSFNEETCNWSTASECIAVTKDDEIRYNFRSGEKISCNYSQLFTDYDNLIMCNNIADVVGIEKLELVNGIDYDEEDDEYTTVYQWYIIDDRLARILSEHSDELIYYNEDLDIHILGVTHWGTGWDYVGASYIM